VNDDLYIWVTRWDDFQTYQKKRGRPWAPPWIRNYTAQLSDARYLDLTDRQRALLHDLRMVFAMTRGQLRHDAATIARYRHRQTRDEDLVALNHAGFIEVCSGTVLERKLNMFRNRSVLEVEEKRKEPIPPSVVKGAGENGGTELETGETEADLLDRELLRDMPF
jgi:hypothetical protein